MPTFLQQLFFLLLATFPLFGNSYCFNNLLRKFSPFFKLQFLSIFHYIKEAPVSRSFPFSFLFIFFVLIFVFKIVIKIIIKVFFKIFQIIRCKEAVNRISNSGSIACYCTNNCQIPIIPYFCFFLPLSSVML